MSQTMLTGNANKQDVDKKPESNGGDLIDKQLNGCYIVEKILGRGSTGTVYKCFNKESEDHVAIKVMSTGVDADYELKYLNFLKAKTPKCENLIDMLDTFSHENLTCIVLPLYGPSIFDAIYIKGSSFNMEDVREMAYQLIKATQFLHDNKMIHSDIKPENILLNRHYYNSDNKSMYKKPNITLCDLASVYEEDEFDDDVITSLPYRALDVVMGFNIGYACDVWSIGCNLFELFTKKSLFTANTQAALYVLIEATLGPFSELQVKQIQRTKKIILPDQELTKYWKNKAICINNYFNHSDEDHKNLYDVIMKMLEVDPTKRISLTEALNLPFFAKFKEIEKNAPTDSISLMNKTMKRKAQASKYLKCLFV